MERKQIILDFGSIVLEAVLFDSNVAAKFLESLPYSISLMQWGEEVYGSVGLDFGEENPIPEIPPGGLAYTNSGNYVCIFFGQTPAWPVEYIGQIVGDEWIKLTENPHCKSVTIRLKE